MEKEALVWSSVFTFLGIALLFGFKTTFTGNFVIEKFYEYKFVLGISFYVGMLFLIFGLILFMFFYFRKRREGKR